MFHSEARTDSTPSRGTVPQGKGREGKRRGMEGNATAILPLVDGEEIALHLKSLTDPTNAMRGVETWL